MTTTKYAYIPNEFGRTWVASRHEARRGVHTPLAYIDINEGNRFDADIFAQIMYWHEPSIEDGSSRLKRERDGFSWLTKNHADWFQETRIRLNTARKCLERLKARNLIFYELHGERGDTTPWIRVNWDEFERRMKLWLDGNHSSLTEKEYDAKLRAYAVKEATPLLPDNSPPVIKEQPPLLPDNRPLLPEVNPNTETTAETGLEYEKEIIPAAQAASDSELDESITTFIEEQLEMPPEEPAEPTDKWLYSYAVRDYFKLAEPTTNPQFSHIQMLVNFFTGKMKATSKQKTWMEHQFTESPLSPEEITGFAIWWSEKYPDDTELPQKPEAIANHMPMFRGSQDYEQNIATAGRFLRKRWRDSQKVVPDESEYLPREYTEALMARLIGGWSSNHE